MTVAVYLPLADKAQWWVEMLQELMPGWDIAALDDITDPDAVTYAVVWRPRTGDLAKFSNLKAIVSIGA
ncbi:MAG: glyoxylate/hydroxypyruvate reductase A, partial [Pelagibaca sp.]|nr:glyoxylate/hydroxypyruvate reductase A [Pelagibaca sp.]